jgi:lipooligosaccharide transport system permease protein
VSRPALLRATEREVLVFRRLWRGSVSISFVQPVLFLGALGFGLGELVEENQGDVDGVTYLAFIVPGLMGASAMLVGGAEALWPLMGRLKWLGSYVAMVNTPISAADAYGGWLVWIAIRTSIAAAAFLVVGAVVGGVPSPWGVLAVPAVVLCALAFAAPIGAFTASQENDFRFPIIMRLGLIPLFLFSGTFFPVEQLPDAIEPLVWLSPLWHGVELARSATTADPTLLAPVHVALLAGLVALGARLGAAAFTRRLTP